MLSPLPATDRTLNEIPDSQPSNARMTRASAHLHSHAAFDADCETRWGWACRALDATKSYCLLREPFGLPRVGDVAVVEVGTVRNHTAIHMADHKRMRLYPGDKLVGVFGNRYATDAYEAEVRTADEIHILTTAGMLGTVISRHRNTRSPTETRMLGYLADGSGRRINLKSLRVQTVVSGELPVKVVLAVGTGMNSGKTTTSTKLVKSLLRTGARVAACKLTGSVCHRDNFELRATSAPFVCDFSDYGFPSTYLCGQEELADLFRTMAADCLQSQPDVVVMEIADGVLQRETQMILTDERVRRSVAGVVLAAPCSSSALFGVERVRQFGHQVIGVSGIISNSPLFMREFTEQSDVTLASSTGEADVLARLVIEHCKARA
jgi:hypothetical protein